MFSTIIGLLFWPLVLLGLFAIILIVIDEGVINNIIDSIRAKRHESYQKKYGSQLDEEAQLDKEIIELKKEIRQQIARMEQMEIDRDKKLHPWKYESCASCRYYERKFYSDGDHEGKCEKRGRWWSASQDPPYDTPACKDFAK